MKKAVKQTVQVAKYFQNTFWQFINSLKVNTKILLATIYDLIFWLLFFGTSYIISIALQREAGFLKSVGFDARVLASKAIAETNVTLVRTFLLKSVLWITLFIFLTLIAYTLMKGLIWLTLFGKKITKEYFKKFFKLNLSWWTIWLPLATFALIGIQQEWKNIAVIMIFILYLHFTTIIQTLFTQKNDIREAFGQTFALGITKLHFFAIPYAFAAAIYWLLTRLLMLVPSRSTMLSITAIIILLFFLSWLRNYVKNVVLEIE